MRSKNGVLAYRVIFNNSDPWVPSPACGIKPTGERPGSSQGLWPLYDVASARFTVLPSRLAQMQAVFCRYHGASLLPDLVLPTPPLLLQEASLTPQCDIEPSPGLLSTFHQPWFLCLLPLPVTLSLARGKAIYVGSAVSVPGPGSSPREISLPVIPGQGLDVYLHTK